jgi:hypothetical protein
MKTKEEFMYGVGTHHMGLPKKHEVTTRLTLRVHKDPKRL